MAPAISCAREQDYEKLRWLKRYGIHQPSFREKDGEINPASDIPIAGWNSYMNHVAATIGCRANGASAFDYRPPPRERALLRRKVRCFQDITTLTCPPNSRSAYWVYTILAPDRDHLQMKLRQQGVQTTKVHLRNDVYSCFGVSNERCPV